MDLVGSFSFQTASRNESVPEEVIDFPIGQMLKHHVRKAHLVVVMDQAPPHIPSHRTMAYIEKSSWLVCTFFILPKVFSRLES